MKQLSKKFKALGNEKRLLIMKMILNQQKLSVGEISNKLKISLPATSKHLLALESAGFIKRNKNGLFVFYDSNFKNQNYATKQALNLLKTTLKIKK